MNNELKLRIEEILSEYGKIEFNMIVISKGFIYEIEIGGKKNKECGAIYNELSDWFDVEFLDFLISREVYDAFSGEFFIENGEICINMTIYGSYDEYNKLESIELSIDENYFTNVLNINLSEIGISDYKEENLYVSFYKTINTPIKNLELFYHCHNNENNIILNNKQINLLSSFIDSKIQNKIPDYSNNFNYELIWEFESLGDGTICFNHYVSTPFKIKLNEVLSC